VDAIQNAGMTGPYHLLGYSAGGLLALAMAQVFAERGEDVAFLGLLDTSLPDPDAESAIGDEDLMRDVAGSLGLLDLATSITPPPTLTELVELAQEQNRLPEGFTTSHVEQMAEVSRHMIRVCPKYELKPWGGPMFFVSAKRDDGPIPDWSPFVMGELRRVEINCHHLDLIGNERVHEVASHIASELASLTPASSV
jgi:thioesterase domain-containing protein